MSVEHIFSTRTMLETRDEFNRRLQKRAAQFLLGIPDRFWHKQHPIDPEDLNIDLQVDGILISTEYGNDWQALSVPIEIFESSSHEDTSAYFQMLVDDLETKQKAATAEREKQETSRRQKQYETLRAEFEPETYHRSRGK